MLLVGSTFPHHSVPLSFERRPTSWVTVGTEALLEVPSACDSWTSAIGLCWVAFPRCHKQQPWGFRTPGPAFLASESTPA